MKATITAATRRAEELLRILPPRGLNLCEPVPRDILESAARRAAEDVLRLAAEVTRLRAVVVEIQRLTMTSYLDQVGPGT